MELSFFWWGGDARAKLTKDALALYTKKHPNVTFKKTWQANQGYFEKLATLTAGNDAPDIFQIDDNYLTEYAARNVTLDLTSYQKSGKLDTTKFPESLWKYGVVDGKLAGVAFGENTQGLVFNKTKLTAASQPLPTSGMSWEDFISWAEKAGAATKVAGTQDPSADYKAFSLLPGFAATVAAAVCGWLLLFNVGAVASGRVPGGLPVLAGTGAVAVALLAIGMLGVVQLGRDNSSGGWLTALRWAGRAAWRQPIAAAVVAGVSTIAVALGALIPVTAPLLVGYLLFAAHVLVGRLLPAEVVTSVPRPPAR